MTTQDILSPEQIAKELRVIQKDMGYNNTEMASLLGITRQQLDQIIDKGTLPKVPAIYRGLFKKFPQYRKSIKALLDD